MIRFNIFSAALLAGLLSLALLRSGAQAQGALPGELPLDAIQFKASHNTYQRSEANDRQLAEYNCWCVELDLNWDGSDSGSYDSDIWVAHNCAGSDTKNLRTEIRDTLNATGIRQRVTFIWMDMKDNSPCPDWGAWPSDYATKVYERVQLALGDVGMSWANVYTSLDFVADGSQWPSWQELVRRGKYVILVLEDHEDDTIHTVFFNTTDSPANWTTSRFNVAFINRKRGGLPDDTTALPTDRDRWIWRSYPDDVTGDNWSTAVSNGFNLIATNAINQTYTNPASVQSSNPVFVDWSASQTAWGTYYRPYTTLAQALARASVAVSVSLKAGSYNGAVTINQSVLITATEGAAVIGAP